MSADLHIHAMTDEMTIDDLKCFFSKNLGSKYFSGFFSDGPCRENKLADCSHWQKIIKSPQIWIGEVSWLKQALMGERDGEYVPDAVQAVHDLIGEDLPVLDANLRAKILKAAIPKEPHPFYQTTKSEELPLWLKENEGRTLFTVSW